MHLTSACNAEGLGGFGLINVQGNVLEGFLEQTVAQMTGGQEFSFLAGKWAVVDREGHLNGRCGNLNKFQRFRCIRRTDGLADAQLFDTGDTNDIADGCGLSWNTLQALNLVEGDNLGAVGNGRVMVVADDDLVIDIESAAGDSADADASNEVVVVDGGNQHLCRAFRVTLRSRDLLEDGVEQDVQIFAADTRLVGSGSLFARAVENLNQTAGHRPPRLPPRCGHPDGRSC